jgi:hypothetical protein
VIHHRFPLRLQPPFDRVLCSANLPEMALGAILYKNKGRSATRESGDESPHSM